MLIVAYCTQNRPSPAVLYTLPAKQASCNDLVQSCNSRADCGPCPRCASVCQLMPAGTQAAVLKSQLYSAHDYWHKDRPETACCRCCAGIWNPVMMLMCAAVAKAHFCITGIINAARYCSSFEISAVAKDISVIMFWSVSAADAGNATCSMYSGGHPEHFWRSSLPWQALSECLYYGCSFT